MGFNKIKIFFLVLAMSALTGCGGYEDSPYPMSRDNLIKLSKTIESNANSYERFPNDSDWKAIKDVYLLTLQDDLGYSFDKTIRAVLLFGYGGREALGVFSPVMKYIINDPNSALEEGLISKRTFELLSLPQNNLNKKELIFIEYVIECQDSNKGLCTSDGLIETIKDENTDPEIAEVFNKYKMGSGDLRSRLGYKFDFNMPQGNLITKPDGSRFNTNFIFDSNEPFIIDKTKVEDQLNANAILKEEKESLFN